MRSNFLAIILAIAIGGGLLAFYFFSTHGGNTFSSAFSVFGRAASSSSETASTTPTGVHNGVFTESSLGFSFAVPDGFNAQKILNDSGETILVQSPKDTSGFQVVISPFSDSGTSITPERVSKEAKLKVAHAVTITVSGVAQGLMFDDLSSTPALRDAWFVYNGYLYQTQTWKSDEALLTQVLDTWKFK